MAKQNENAGPVATIINFCKKNPGKSRGWLQKQLEKQGLNPATIRTQIQRFRKAGGQVQTREANGPCQQVRAICAASPTSSRKDLLAKCIAAGINQATAATQIQKWRTEMASQDLHEAALSNLTDLG